MILPLIVGIILGGIVGMIAEQKNRAFFPWALYGFFFFFFAIIHIAIIGDKAYEDLQLKGMGYVKCSVCAEMIRRDASICRHCKTTIGEKTVEAQPNSASTTSEMKHCRWCKAETGGDEVNRCPSCGGLQKHFLRDNPILMVLLFFLVAVFFVVLTQVSEEPLPTTPAQNEFSQF